MLIDSHCHIQDKEFDRDRAAVLERARENGVQAFVAIGTDMVSSEKAIALAAAEDDVYATVGVHPHEAKTLDRDTLQGLRELASAPKVVAIGETGLDFYRNLSSPEQQRRAFRQQLELAAELRLPVVIHSREAEEETYQILAEHREELASSRDQGRPLGVMHCFAGDISLALRYTQMGFLISIPGICTYPKAEILCAVASGLPLRCLVVETDSPYLAPQSKRGRRNEPSYLRETVEHIARLRHEAYEAVASGSSLSAARLFGLGESEGEDRAREGGVG
ncbi:MAG TPA: TatD family hydrolase [Dehalococcoidia bacterium]|nr:TatD family hydrolase [Dehalococcoidia bacterium]